jgi:hypothetical protein
MDEESPRAGRSAKRTTFTLTQEQHLYAGALSATGSAILLELLVNLITDTSGLCFCAEAGYACRGGLVFWRRDGSGKWVVV